MGFVDRVEVSTTDSTTGCSFTLISSDEMRFNELSRTSEGGSNDVLSSEGNETSTWVTELETVSVLLVCDVAYKGSCCTCCSSTGTERETVATPLPRFFF